MSVVQLPPVVLLQQHEHVAYTPQQKLQQAAMQVASTSGQVLGPASSSALLALGQGYAALFVGAITAGLVGIPLLASIRSVR